MTPDLVVLAFGFFKKQNRRVLVVVAYVLISWIYFFFLITLLGKKVMRIELILRILESKHSIHRDSSVDKMLTVQAWRPKFNAQNLHKTTMEKNMKACDCDLAVVKKADPPPAELAKF